MLLHEIGHKSLVLATVHQDHINIGVVLPYLLQIGHLLDAVWAPRRPKVHDSHAALKVGNLLRRTVGHGQGSIRSRISFHHASRFPVAYRALRVLASICRALRLAARHHKNGHSANNADSQHDTFRYNKRLPHGSTHGYSPFF